MKCNVLGKAKNDNGGKEGVPEKKKQFVWWFQEAWLYFHIHRGDTFVVNSYLEPILKAHFL